MIRRFVVAALSRALPFGPWSCGPARARIPGARIATLALVSSLAVGCGGSDDGTGRDEVTGMEACAVYVAALCDHVTQCQGLEGDEFNATSHECAIQFNEICRALGEDPSGLTFEEMVPCLYDLESLSCEADSAPSSCDGLDALVTSA